MTFRKTAKALTAVFLLLSCCAAWEAAEANFSKGVQAYIVEDYDTALIEWAIGAKSGDARSMAYIGYIYFAGLGLEQDDKRALEWFQRAADLGDPDGIATLARMYAHGWGVSRDVRRGYELMHRVKDVVNYAAQMVASEFYENGYGTPIDLEKALSHAKRLPLVENGMPVISARDARIRELERKIADL